MYRVTGGRNFWPGKVGSFEVPSTGTVLPVLVRRPRPWAQRTRQPASRGVATGNEYR